MKYIIDIPDDPMFVTACYLNDGIPKAFNLELEPYTEPDRKAIEDEVWELARKIADMGYEEFSKCFGISDDYWEANIMDIMTYQEAQARYEAWKKQKDEIRVGDEVEYVCCDETVRFVVIGLIKGHTAYGFKFPCDYDDVGEYCDIDMLRKTGRHFDEVDELLRKARDTDED